MLNAAVGDFLFQIQILTVSEMYALTLTIKQVGRVRKQKLLNACQYIFFRLPFRFKPHTQIQINMHNFERHQSMNACTSL